MVDVVGVVLGLLLPVHRVKVEVKVVSLDGLEERSERLKAALVNSQRHKQCSTPNVPFWINLWG